MLTVEPCVGLFLGEEKKREEKETGEKRFELVN
jgi:hypothetical protein